MASHQCHRYSCSSADGYTALFNGHSGFTGQIPPFTIHSGPGPGCLNRSEPRPVPRHLQTRMYVNIRPEARLSKIIRHTCTCHNWKHAPERAWGREVVCLNVKTDRQGQMKNKARHSGDNKRHAKRHNWTMSIQIITHSEGMCLKHTIKVTNYVLFVKNVLADSSWVRLNKHH